MSENAKNVWSQHDFVQGTKGVTEGVDGMLEGWALEYVGEYCIVRSSYTFWYTSSKQEI